MIDKFVSSIAEALSGVQNGATVLVGGFGAVGQPNQLIEGMLEAGLTDLTIVANNSGYGDVGLAKLLKARRIAKLICSYPRIAGSTAFEDLYAQGGIELELVPQGTLAERIRAAGAGLPAFYTPTAVGTSLAAGKEVREFNGREYVMEMALPGDVALVEAWTADRWGNLTYRDAGRNFNPIMAMAARLTVVQTQHTADLGAIDPQTIVTPGAFVDRVVHIPHGDPVL